jgi:hypothetical protein
MTGPALLAVRLQGKRFAFACSRDLVHVFARFGSHARLSWRLASHPALPHGGKKAVGAVQVRPQAQVG